MGVHGTDGKGFQGHHMGKQGFIPGHVFGQHHCSIVGGFDQAGFHQFAQWQLLTGAQADGIFSGSIGVGADGGDFVHISVFYR